MSVYDDFKLSFACESWLLSRSDDGWCSRSDGGWCSGSDDVSYTGTDDWCIYLK